MKLNLSKRITLFIVVLILLVSLGLGTGAVLFSSNAVRTEVENALILLADEADDYIERTIQANIDILEAIARRNTIRSMNWEEQKEALIQELDRLQHRGYLGMGIVFADGVARYSDGSEAELGDREYVKKAFAGESNISDLIVSRVTNAVVLMYAVPIYSHEGQIEAVLIARRPGTALNDITDRMGFGENGYAYVMASDGTLYAHPNRENVLNQRNVLEDIENNGEFKNWGLAIQELGIGNSGVINYELLGSNRYIGVSIVESTGWIVGVGAHESDVLAGLNNLRNIIIIISLACLMIGIAVAIILGKSISKPIVKLSEIIERLSKYDLTFDENSEAIKYMKRKDEIGTITIALATMQQNLVTLIKTIADNSYQVATSSEELTATSQQSATAADEVARTIEEIARGAGEQAKDTEKGVEHITELSGLIERDQQYVQQLNDSTEEVNQLKEEGLEALRDLIEKMQANNKSAEEINEIIINTNESAQKIESASQMISSIAEQTNLLALNAAIEAARAGEAGRGFAVVAEEIRKLAEQSSAFTEEITSIIKELTDKTGHAVNTMEEVGKSMESQSNTIKTTNTKFQGINDAIEGMKKVVKSINKSGEEMEVKKNEIIGVIESLSAISQENAAGTEEAAASVEEQTASMEEIASASETLAQLAEEMQESIAKFKY